MVRGMASKRATPEPAAKVDDVVLVHGRSEDGKTLAVLRKRGETLSAGLLSAAEEGKPLHGDLVRLTPREGAPFLADVEVLHEAPRAPLADRAGPAQVSSPAYREGWNAVFGRSGGRASAPDADSPAARGSRSRAMLN